MAFVEALPGARPNPSSGRAAQPRESWGFRSRLMQHRTDSGISYLTATPPDEWRTTETTMLIVHGLVERPPLNLMGELYRRGVPVAAIEQPSDHRHVDGAKYPSREDLSARDNGAVMDELPGKLDLALISRGFINGTIAAANRAPQVRSIVAVNGALVSGESVLTLVGRGFRETGGTMTRLAVHPKEIPYAARATAHGLGEVLLHPRVTVARVNGLPAAQLAEPHRVLVANGTRFGGVFAENDSLVPADVARAAHESGFFEELEFVRGARHIGHKTNPRRYASAIVRVTNRLHAPAS